MVPNWTDMFGVLDTTLLTTTTFEAMAATKSKSSLRWAKAKIPRGTSSTSHSSYKCPPRTPHRTLWISSLLLRTTYGSKTATSTSGIQNSHWTTTIERTLTRVIQKKNCLIQSLPYFYVDSNQPFGRLLRLLSHKTSSQSMMFATKGRANCPSTPQEKSTRITRRCPTTDWITRTNHQHT